MCLNGFLTAVTRFPGAWFTCHCDVVGPWSIRVDAVAYWKVTSRRVTLSNLGAFLGLKLVLGEGILLPRDQYRRTASMDPSTSGHPASRRVRFHPKSLARSRHLLQLVLWDSRWRWRALAEGEKFRITQGLSVFVRCPKDGRRTQGDYLI
jgi:hypothetical protein